jgi:hypothetical protein
MKMEASAGTLVNSPKLSPCSAGLASGSGRQEAARGTPAHKLGRTSRLPWHRPPKLRTRRLLARPWLERIPYLSCFGFT